MPILLVCGYRRTGKDTLYQHLSSECSTYSWNMYQRQDTEPILFGSSDRYEQIAFAAALKLEASQKYGIPIDIPDSEKDVKQYVHYQSGEIVSARDIYIEWGRIQREIDPNYWCKTAISTVQNSNSTWYVITDWRFKNEEVYVRSECDHVITCRLYRPDVPIPPSDIESEHQLDCVPTDILMLPPDIKIADVTSIFPQYSDYVFTGTV